jgi:hypothetical protein
MADIDAEGSWFCPDCEAGSAVGQGYAGTKRQQAMMEAAQQQQAEGGAAAGEAPAQRGGGEHKRARVGRCGSPAPLREGRPSC